MMRDTVHVSLLELVRGGQADAFIQWATRVDIGGNCPFEDRTCP